MTRSYSTFSEIDPDLFRSIIEGSRDTAPETTAQASSGIMSPSTRPQPRPQGLGVRSIDTTSAIEESLLGVVAQGLARNTDNPEQLANAVVPKPSRMETPRLSEFDGMVPVEQFLRGDPTREALGSAPVGPMPISRDSLPNVDTSTPPQTRSTRAALGEADALTNVEDEITSTNANFAMLKIGEESTPITSATHLTNMFDALGELEGYYAHVDGRGIFTMPYGVVPDDGSVTGPDGTAFDPRGRRGRHGFTTSTAATVNTSNATHTVNGNTVKRSDYDSDESFARAVVSLYDREAAKTYGEGWDNLSDDARSMALDMAWNGGVNSLGWSTVRPSLAETSKENPDTAVLFGFTQNMRSGINYPRGLFKRRLIQYNRIANPEDVASTYSTEALMRNGQRVGTRYIAHRADGTNIGSWDRYDAADDPSTPSNERRVASNETVAANVGLH